MIELLPCPKCDGEVKLYASCGIGAISICKKCKAEFDICGVDELKIYDGCKIRKSTVTKIYKMWNKFAEKAKIQKEERNA